MRIQPRQQLLGIWRSIAQSSLRDGKWVWDGQDSANSLSDAKQLLCIMTPAAEMVAFRLDQPDETADDVLNALSTLGSSGKIPILIVKVLSEYMDRYTDEAGMPTFSAGAFLDSRSDAPPSDSQRGLDVVASFAASVTLCLATLQFLRNFSNLIRSNDLMRDVRELETMASKRLTSAMIGLLRSFTIHVFEADSDAGRALVGTLNQGGLPSDQFIDLLQRSLAETAAGFREITIGSGQVDEFDGRRQLFECGWSWGVILDAPVIETDGSAGKQRPGIAEPAPYLYFTVAALDCMSDLFAARTRILGLLDEEQQRLSRALQLRWDLTQSYWSIIAKSSGGAWPLEDIPWRTTDRDETDYYSLLVTSITVRDLLARQSPDADIDRVGRILAELAERGRVIRRPVANDPAVSLHDPSTRIALVGSERLGPELCWTLSDFSPLLLRYMIVVARILRDTDLNNRLLALAEEVWNHLLARRLEGGVAHGLWDQPAAVYPLGSTRRALASWQYTERVVRCLVTAAEVINGPPLRSVQLSNLATDLLSEAKHMLDQELLNGSGAEDPAVGMTISMAQARLHRADEVIAQRPGTAASLLLETLQALDRLAIVREQKDGI